MSDLVKRLRGLQVSYSYAHEAADKIEQLERELAEARRVIFEAGREAGSLMAELTAEKALADQLHFALITDGVDVTEVFAAYRKARGL